MRLPLIFEMETSDPDDFLALLWLADHPGVDLLAVLITPGGVDQVKLVDWALTRCNSHAELGVLNSTPLDDEKARVSAFHWRIYESAAAHVVTRPVKWGPPLLAGLLSGAQTPITYLTGCAPKQLGAAFRGFDGLVLDRWIAQGFFAGDNVVAPEHRLEKFKGKTTCPSFNPGGDHKSALELLANAGIKKRICVSKNVCHGVTWTREVHDELKTLAAATHQTEWLDKIVKYNLPVDRVPGIRRGLQMMVYGLDCYLRDKGVGKAMHDILAAAVVLDESVVELKEVEIYRERGEWGAREKAGTGTWISVAYNPTTFVEVLAR